MPRLLGQTLGHIQVWKKIFVSYQSYSTPEWRTRSPPYCMIGSASSALVANPRARRLVSVAIALENVAVEVGALEGLAEFDFFALS
jgi:hypothetical protein